MNDSESKHSALEKRMVEPMIMAQHLYQQLKDSLQHNLLKETYDIDYNKASYATLIRIAQEYHRNDKTIRDIINRIDKTRNEICSLLTEFDGTGRFLKVNDIDKQIKEIEDGVFSHKPITKADSRFYVNYSIADLEWLIRAYNDIVLPCNSSFHKPYNRKLSIIMRREYVESIFKNKTLKLTKVNTWEDPYENFFLRHKIKLYKGKIYDKEAENIYGICWSTKQSSDALWRIYSDNKSLDGIQLNTTTSKLLKVITNHNFPISVFGGITYDNENGTLFKAFDKQCNTQMYQTFPPIEQLTLESLYLKRNAFDHEREYRTIVWLTWEQKQKLLATGIIEQDSNVHIDDKFLNINIDPSSLFDEIILDPRLSYDATKAQEHTNNLINAGVDGSKIRISELYKYE